MYIQYVYMYVSILLYVSNVALNKNVCTHVLAYVGLVSHEGNHLEGFRFGFQSRGLYKLP